MKHIVISREELYAYAAENGMNVRTDPRFPNLVFCDVFVARVGEGGES